MNAIPANEQYILTLNEEQLRDYFKASLDCPLPIRSSQRYHLLQDELIWLWKDVCYKHERDVETKYIFDDDDERDFQLSEDDFDELKPLAISLSYWIEDAKNEFLERAKPITAVMANSDIYKKHFPNRKMFIEDLIKLAIQNEAGYFYYDISVMELDDIMIKSIKPFFKQIIDKETIRYGVKCLKKMGVTDIGEESEFLLVEINKSSAIAHAYPCSEEKAKSCQTFKEKVGDQIWYDEDYDVRLPEDEIDINLYIEL
jgi:hypothetical protein